MEGPVVVAKSDHGYHVKELVFLTKLYLNRRNPFFLNQFVCPTLGFNLKMFPNPTHNIYAGLLYMFFVNSLEIDWLVFPPALHTGINSNRKKTHICSQKTLGRTFSLKYWTRLVTITILSLYCSRSAEVKCVSLCYLWWPLIVLRNLGQPLIVKVSPLPQPVQTLFIHSVFIVTSLTVCSVCQPLASRQPCRASDTTLSSSPPCQATIDADFYGL